MGHGDVEGDLISSSPGFGFTEEDYCCMAFGLHSSSAFLAMKLAYWMI